MADLATKLGIKPGYKVALLGAQAALAAALEQACPAAEFFETISDAPYELIFFWPTQLAGLEDAFADLQRQIVPDGAIWAVIPKQRMASRISFSWEELQAAGLQTIWLITKSPPSPTRSTPRALSSAKIGVGSMAPHLGPPHKNAGERPASGDVV
jgi:hypothetical protein